MTHRDDDDLFADETFMMDGDPTPAPQGEPWPVLVVDDDEQVHAMTRVLLNDFTFEGRRFAMVGAYSAEEARAILAVRTDLPVILLDVVMETQDAGLRLVHHIRRELDNRHIRIILRTGQPGQAPERDVIVAYDINDYKSKSELTAQKLFTSLVGAVRGWRDLMTIEHLNRSLEERVAERTAELERQSALAEEQRRFIENLVELMPSPVWYKDAGGRYTLCNRAFRELFPEPPGGMPGTLFPAGEAARQAAPPAEPYVFETGVVDPSGQRRELLVAKRRLSDPRGGAAGVIGIATDITERRRMERELHRLATIDPLSGAYNRRRILELLELLLTSGGGEGEASSPLPSASLLMLDIDHFKRINDEHGHAAGDAAIRHSVAEIRRHLRAGDAIGRIGGEEFTILLPASPRDVAQCIAERLRAGLAALSVPLPDGGVLALTASFGLTALRPLDDDVEAVLHRADQALYRAKANGRNRVEVA